MSSSVISSSNPSPQLIKTKIYPKSHHIEIGLIILFLCLTIPSLIVLTLLYRRQPPSSPTPSVQNDFHRISLTNYPQARCMDESIASYYIRLAENSHSRWLIYFDGGWFCYSQESCDFRRQYSPNLITTKNFNEEILAQGIFASLKHFNILYAPYCSSDLWSGSSNQTSSHGHHIFQAIFEHEKYFLHAKQIVFAGFSAGGLGLLLNLPDLLPKFSPHTDLRLLLDSAWFIDYPSNHNGISKITQGMTYWNTQLPKACHAQPRYKCLLGSEAIQQFPLSMQIFVIQSLLDLTQLQLDQLTDDFSLKVRDDLRQWNSRISIFAPACPSHGFLFRPVWSKFDIQQHTLASVLHRWLKSRKKKKTTPTLQLIDQNFYSSYCPQNDQEIF